MNARELSRDLTEEDIKNYLKRGAPLNKTVLPGSVSVNSGLKGVGISKSSGDSNLDTILASETLEILNRAAKEVYIAYMLHIILRYEIMR